MRFGLVFDNLEKSRTSGLVKATLHLGDHVEGVRPHLGVWSRQDYSAHWKNARQLCIAETPFVVCATSRAPDNWDIWVGRRTSGGYRFFNCLTKADDALLSDHLVHLPNYSDFGPEHDAGVSTWDVALADIAS